MFAFILPPFLRGIITLILHMLVIVIFGILIYSLAVIKYIIPIKAWRKKCNYALSQMPVGWSDANVMCMRLFTKLEIIVIGAENLPKQDWYLITANHRSWSDVLILYRAFSHRIPVLKFFMKSQLLWIPILGFACWLVGFPFMKRYSKEKIAKKPHLKGKDAMVTKKICSRFKEDNIPMSIISFAEGTRYTYVKAQKQNTPFENLLKPRAGALAHTLMAMQDCLEKFLNITIVYPTGRYNFWDYLCGSVRRVVIKVEYIPLDASLKGDYENDRQYRAHFQDWLNALWEKKDLEIDALMKKYVE